MPDVGRRFHQPDLESGLDDVNFVGGISFPDVTDGEAGQRSAVSELIRRSHRGKFRRYIGMSAGVGKTCRMLQEARQLPTRASTRIGCYRNARPPERKPVEGLSARSPQTLLQGRELEEMDSRPSSTSAPRSSSWTNWPTPTSKGSENPKRWQDVMQTSTQGSASFLAVNIQHIERLNEVVEEITGTRSASGSRQRAGDGRRGGEHDLTADELIERLKAGKIYRPDKIAAALGNFFTQDNLLQLRELALKEVALRVERERLDSEVTGSRNLPARQTAGRDRLLEKRARRVILQDGAHGHAPERRLHGALRAGRPRGRRPHSAGPAALPRSTT